MLNHHLVNLLANFPSSGKMSVMKKIVLFILILCSAANITAQEFKKAGTAGFVFLGIPVHARTAALGEASITLQDLNSAAIFINPAVLDFGTDEHSVAVSYSPWIADIKHYSAAYSFSTEFGRFAIGANVLDYGTFQRTVKSTGQRFFEIVGTYSANAVALYAGYAKRLTDKFSFGFNFKYVKESIDIYSASNVLFDGGMIYFTGFRNLRIAATVQNFGVDAKFINDSFRMPSVLRLGIADDFYLDNADTYRLTLLVEALHPGDNEERLNLGTEFSFLRLLQIRAGYKFFYDEESLSLGIGISPGVYLPVNLDFSWSDYGRLGNLMRFSLSMGI